MSKDKAYDLTEKELAALEERINKYYNKAYVGLTETIQSFFAEFKEQDEEKRKLVEKGELSEKAYKQWRLDTIQKGDYYKAMQNKVAERMTSANEVAMSYVNDATPNIYSLNRNYEAYNIEKSYGDIGFTMWDEATVRKMIVEEPDVMPYYPPERAVQRGIDLAYGKRQISANVTSSIIQGKSIQRIADDLQKSIVNMNRTSAIRAARTSCTAAQNAGRQDSFEYASKMGINVRKMWVATKDGRTRHEHGMADGQVVGYDEPFVVGGYEMMFPGDPSAPAHLVYNCRCRMRTVEKEGIEAEPRQMRVRDPVTGKNVVVNEMTYSEWAQWKTNVQQQASTGMLRQSKNKGAFEFLPERMTKKHIREVAKEYGVDLKGLTLVIADDEQYLEQWFWNTGITGRADYTTVGRIDFFPQAFTSEEQLLRTLYHERIHTMQFRQFGVEEVINNRPKYEDAAYELEEAFISKLKQEGKL